MSTPKHLKRDDEPFELLPNELFVEIFGYLNGVDAVYAFSQLNNRFQSLLDQYVNTFDFESISKARFHFVTQHHDIHRWRSLTLSDDDETPGQIKLFCQLFPPAEYISQLQSLSLVNMQPKLAQEVFSHLGAFDQLVSLTIGKICGEDIPLIELPSLKRLVVTSCKHTDWLMNFHSLENMEYTLEYDCDCDYMLTLPTTLKQLKLFYEEEKHGRYVRKSLRQLSQLTKLSLYDNGSNSPFPEGGKWEELIQSSLPLLIIFQFYFPFVSSRSAINVMNQAVGSFSTPFYLIEKCWFIRCNSINRSPARGVLYSLPFAFAKIPVNTLSFDTSMSTLCSSDISQTQSNSYAKVKTLIFNEKCEILSQDFPTFSIIKLVLSASLPTKCLFLFTNLRYLEFGSNVHMTSTDFTHLLLNTPHLQSLSISSKALETLTEKFRNNAVCDQLSERIQSLTIADRRFNRPDLNAVIIRFLPSIVRIFGKKCKHLSINVSSHLDTVLPILRRMRQLRSLHIRCRPSCHKSRDSVMSCLQQQSTGPADLNFVQIIDGYDYSAWFGDRP